MGRRRKGEGRGGREDAVMRMLIFNVNLLMCKIECFAGCLYGTLRYWLLLLPLLSTLPLSTFPLHFPLFCLILLFLNLPLSSLPPFLSPSHSPSPLHTLSLALPSSLLPSLRAQFSLLCLTMSKGQVRI